LLGYYRRLVHSLSDRDVRETMPADIVIAALRDSEFSETLSDEGSL
jgi:hypothetical protein